MSPSPPETKAGTAADGSDRPRTLIIACGALAREIKAIINTDRLDHLTLTCLPAWLHNRPQWIPEAVRARIRENRAHYERIYVAYADCGTGGQLDQVLDEEGVTRIGGAHCYAFYTGQEAFAALAEAEPGTFYLTDFLVRQFDTLIIEGLGLDHHPELMPLYFDNYRRLVHLAQIDDPELKGKAEDAARRLGLDFEHVVTGYGELASFIHAAASGAPDHGPADHRLLARHSGPGDHQGRAEDGPARAAGALPGSHRPRRHAREAHRNRRLSRGLAPVRS